MILSLIIVGAVILLATWFDRKFYPATHLNNHAASGQFFNNPSYDEPVNRFLLSKGGMIILSLIFMATFLLTDSAHGAV